MVTFPFILTDTSYILCMDFFMSVNCYSLVIPVMLYVS